MKKGNLTKIIGASVAAGGAMVSSSAHAVLPAEAISAFTEVTGFATDMIAAAWPVVSLVVVGGVGIKLFKKFVSKAT